METYVYDTEFQKKCQPYKCKINYKKKDKCHPHNFNDNYCRNPGYQPQIPNPGGLKFYGFYYPFQKVKGNNIIETGEGWKKYDKTGNYYNWWN